MLCGSPFGAVLNGSQVSIFSGGGARGGTPGEQVGRGAGGGRGGNSGGGGLFKKKKRAERSAMGSVWDAGRFGWGGYQRQVQSGRAVGVQSGVGWERRPVRGATG